MSQEESNVSLIREAYEKWHDTKGGSIDHWTSLLGDEIKFMSLAQGAQGVEFTSAPHTKEQIGGYFEGLTTQFTMNYYHVDEYIAQNDRVVVKGKTSWTNKASGKTVETPKVDIFRLQDGKVVEFEEYYDTAGLIACTICD
ncbi:MAG: nuclear transport factor 2 family protein [Pseudomonadota bacterium]